MANFVVTFDSKSEVFKCNVHGVLLHAENEAGAETKFGEIAQRMLTFQKVYTEDEFKQKLSIPYNLIEEDNIIEDGLLTGGLALLVDEATLRQRVKEVGQP